MTVSEEVRPDAAGAPADAREAWKRLGGALSPTTARYALLIVTLALAGAFAGQLVHNLALGMSWAQGVSRCLEDAQRVPGSVLERAQWSARCEAPLQRRMALVSLAGSAAVLLLGLAGLYVLPRRLRRAAGPLKPVPDAWQRQADRVADEMGVAPAPRVTWGGDRVRDAFTLRRGRSPLIILPKSIRFLHEREAAEIIRHEVGHVRAGDVTLVWLTQGVWWALMPVLLAAPLLHVMPGVRSQELTSWGVISTPLWVEYGLRCVLLVAVAALVARMIMRSREHEADLTACHGRPLASWETLLGRPQPRRTLLESARARHPSHQRRLHVLRDPQSYLRPTVLDTVAVGLLTGILLDAVNQLMGLLLTGTTWSPAPVSALAAGLFLTLCWASTAWHEGDDRRGKGATASWWLLPTLAVSTAAGLSTGLQNTGVTESGTLLGGSALVAVPLAVMAAGVLGAAFAGLWRSRAEGRRNALPDRLTEIAVGAVVFSGALWCALDFRAALLVFSGTEIVKAAVFVGPDSPSSDIKAIALAAVAVLAALAAVGGARRHELRWLPPVATALGAALGAVATRLLAQPPGSAGDMTGVWKSDVLTAVCAGAVCAVALVALRGSGGLGHALYLAPLATTLTATALWAARFPAWTHPFATWTTVLLSSALSGLAVLLLLLAVPAGLLPSWDTRMRWALMTAPPLAGITAALAVTALQHSGEMFLLS